MRSRDSLVSKLIFAGILLSCSAASYALTISEIMYHPLAPTNDVDADEFEYIEIHNPGPSILDLSGAYFSDGITYTFSNGVTLASNAYGVLVYNAEAFSSRYPSVTNIFPGTFEGHLSNNGEELTLVSSNGSPMFSVNYDDWSRFADGFGSSLIRSGNSEDPDDPSYWCEHAELHGGPGKADVCRVQDIVINEVLTHTDPPYEDAVELKNLSGSAIDASGWYLSDKPEHRFKYRITNTVIAADGYAAFYEYQFNTNAAFDTNNTPFALSSSRGDQLFVTSVQTNGSFGLVDMVEFGPAENGVSFGRFPDGTGELTAMRDTTFGVSSPATVSEFRTGGGQSNSLPRIGPVIISEVMYHPANDDPDEEYVELLNISTSAVSLFNPLHKSNTWIISGGVDFTFPTDVTIEPGDRVLITGASSPEDFRLTYNLDSNVPVFGPWSGKLNNSGESILLYKPDSPESNFVPYILVDRVDYRDSDPWPTAPDGNGPSLERLSVSNFANDANNWFVGPPGGSPGIAPAGGFVNPSRSPDTPSVGQAFTVSVSIVSAEVPTQVVIQASIDGVVSNYIMVDDGSGSDPVAGDHNYAAVLPGQANGTWVYYRFTGYQTNDHVFSEPVPVLDYHSAPDLAVRMSGNGLRTTIESAPHWQTFTYSGQASHSNIFFMYLKGPGELLVDDVSVVFDGSERITDGSFDSAMPGAWFLNGNHIASFRDVLVEEESNAVAHIVTEEAGNGFGNNVSTLLDPSATFGDTGHVSLRTRRVLFEREQWHALLVGSEPPDIVINEIMYHPARTNETLYEYVELYNAGTSTVDLSDWYLSGIDFVIPTNTFIAGESLLVCCASKSTIQQAYGITNTIGNWNGKLKNSGERLKLINAFGRVVDDVAYSDNFPWPITPDGLGSSLERIGFGSSSNTWLNWAASMAPTNWRKIVWTQQVHDTSASLRMWLDFEGKFLLDDVRVVSAGESSNRVSNGDFESGFTSWFTAGNQNRAHVEAGVGRSLSAAMVPVGNFSRIEANDTLVTVYGDAVTNLLYSAPIQTESGSLHEVSLYVKRSGLAENFFVQFDETTNVIALGQHGTPGKANSIGPDTPGGYLSVTQEYAVCPVGTPNVLRVKLIPSNAVETAHVFYRVFGTNGYEFSDGHYTATQLLDNGISPDDTAGDGEYAGTMPAVTQNWSIVRYHVAVTLTNGHTVSSPHPDNPSRDLAYWVQDDTVQSNVPNWHVLVDGHPVLFPISKRVCAVSPEGQVFVDVRLRHRGNKLQTNDSSGVALRMNDDQLLDTWFAPQQNGINFRHRRNDSPFDHLQLLQESIAYHIQALLGYPTPRRRYICLWENGRPSITTELEAPGEAYLSGNGISDDDYVTRFTREGAERVGGDEDLNNIYIVFELMRTVSNEFKQAAIREHIEYEPLRNLLGFLSTIGAYDYGLLGNMFNHRSADNLRWRQYPWDMDKNFLVAQTNLHPYYQTLLHLGVDSTSASPMSQTLFYPESGDESEYTIPYRYRQQMSLWRNYHTILTTNFLYPMIDDVIDRLNPTYTQLSVSRVFLDEKAAQMREFIDSRRNFIMNAAWSDKNTAIWNPTNIYDPSQVVINEIMYDPEYGGEYLELYNRATQTVDLSWWTLQSNEGKYRFPHGTMLGPTSFLVLADSQAQLTNYFEELSDAQHMVQRNTGVPLWDDSITWTSATEYATRVTQQTELTLANGEGILILYDVISNIVDSVSYSNSMPWPSAEGISLERVDPATDSSAATNWRLSLIIGTPGSPNSASIDKDNDNLTDTWEWEIMSASSGTITNIQGVLPGDDFDGDGIRNEDEFILGTDPTVMDQASAGLSIHQTNQNVLISFTTFDSTGPAYQIYSERRYTLQTLFNLADESSWLAITGFSNRIGTGSLIFYTNQLPATSTLYRFNTRLDRVR